MRLEEILQARKEAILGRWIEELFSTYPGRAGQFFGRQADPFSNPVGNRVRTGTREVLDALLSGRSVEKVRRGLEDIISVRAVQCFLPSEAVGFVLGLKGIIRAEIADFAADPRLSSDLVQLEGRIDRIALAAFDLFAERRERIYQLRVDEVKRNVAWIMDRMNRRRADAQPPPLAGDAGAARAAGGACGSPR